MVKILEVMELEKAYGRKLAVRGLSFSVEEGKVVGLLGPNGAGKTTAFYMAIGLVRCDAGKILFKGQDVTHLPIHKRAQMGMGYLAQEPSIFRNLTVEENIFAILEIMPLSHTQRTARLRELLTELHLRELAPKKACTLSGGERRRLEIARALVTNPSLLLLDEPFANVDPLTVADVKQMIRHLARRGISILITDHNAREIFSIADRCCLIQEGRVLLEGSVETLIKSELARSSYLGHNFSM